MAAIKVVRFNNKQGKRKYDRSAVVLWDVEHDDVNRRTIIQTEETRYYITDDWLFSFLTRKEEYDAEIEVYKSKSGVKASARHKRAA